MAKDRKFHRQRDQREALVKSLVESLIIHGSIETTLPKAKTVARYADKLVSKAKKGQEHLHSRRKIIASLSTTDTAHRLVDEIAPQLASRNSGYFRVERTGLRRGDGTQLAKVSFVDKLKTQKQPSRTSSVKKVDDSAGKDKPDTRQITAEAANKTTAKAPKAPPAIPAKRSGRRGNR